MKETLMSFVALLVGSYLLFVLLMFVMQRQYIYFPDKSTPSRFAYDAEFMEVIEVRTSDGLTLKAWYSAPAPGKPVLVYFHGNAGNIGLRAPVVKPYIDQGYGVLLAEYRGYGGNPGEPTEKGLYKDGRAYISWLTEERKVPVENIVLIGVSLGSGVAVKMTVEYRDIGALILKTPFTSLAALGQKHMFYLPVYFLIRDRYNNLGRIKDVEAPLLILHGKRDRIVPFSFGRKLFEAASQPKEIEVFPHASHNDLHMYDIQGKVMSFLEQGDRFNMNSETSRP